MSLSIDAAVFNHIGGRSNNEDNFYFNGVYMEREQMNQGSKLEAHCTDASQIYAVCDGMGGAEFGEEASLRVAQALKSYQKSTAQPDSSVNLNKLIAETNDSVDEISLSRGMPSGSSGSTIAMLTIQDWCFRAVHVGDSRLYLLRDGKLHRLTRDDSEVQRMVDDGEITVEEAWRHPMSNVITRHLGMPTDGAPLVPTVSDRIDMKPGDRFLICSDGLSDVVRDAHIQQIMNAVQNPADLTARLVRTALAEAQAYGISSDNVTVMVVDVKGVGDRDANKKRVGRLRTAAILSGLALAGSLAGLVWTLLKFWL